MLVPVGNGLFGRVDVCDGARGRAFVYTRFFHVAFVPLVPLESVAETSTLDGVPGPLVELPIQPRSALAAYLRATVPLSTAGAVGLVVAAASAWVTSFAWLGRLSPDEKAQRRVFERFTGYPLDVALLGDRRARLRQQLHDAIAARAALLPAGYREQRDPTSQWPEIALDPSHDDLPLLHAALTLARLEGSCVPARAGAMREVFSAVWRRIVAIEAGPPRLA